MLKLKDIFVTTNKGDLILSTYYDIDAKTGSRYTIPRQVIKIIDHKTLVRKLLIGYRELSKRAGDKALFAGPGIPVTNYAPEVENA